MSAILRVNKLILICRADITRFVLKVLEILNRKIIYLRWRIQYKSIE